MVHRPKLHWALLLVTLAFDARAGGCDPLAVDIDARTIYAKHPEDSRAAMLDLLAENHWYKPFLVTRADPGAPAKLRAHARAEHADEQGDSLIRLLSLSPQSFAESLVALAAVQYQVGIWMRARADAGPDDRWLTFWGPGRSAVCPVVRFRHLSEADFQELPAHAMAERSRSLLGDLGKLPDSSMARKIAGEVAGEFPRRGLRDGGLPGLGPVLYYRQADRIVELLRSYAREAREDQFSTLASEYAAVICADSEEPLAVTLRVAGRRAELAALEARDEWPKARRRAELNDLLSHAGEGIRETELSRAGRERWEDFNRRAERLRGALLEAN